MHLTTGDFEMMGLRLRNVREQRSLSIRELSLQADVCEKQIGHMEHGLHITLDAMIVLVRALDTSLDYVAMGMRSPQNSNGLILRSDDELKSMIGSGKRPSENT